MRESTKRNLIIAAGYALAMIAGMIIGPKFFREDGNRQNSTFLPFLNSRGDKLSSVLRLVDERYVEELSQDSLKEIAITEILTHLDPHTYYLPAQEARMLNEDLEGNFFGIGIEYLIIKDTVTVTSVIPGGPAARSGLRLGDQILAVEQEKVSGVSIAARDVVASIRGKRGTSVDLLVKRGGGTLQKTIRRDRITISSIAAAYPLTRETGYIRIDRFGSETGGDFVKALRKLQRRGMKSLVLDLRGNGGGYLNAATALADQFLPEKKLIVYTQGANEPRTAYYATAEGDFEKGQLVILIDENSASASEIVAGAVQDLDRGTIIGRRSFGKGLVQEQFDFGDGSALNLTIARYYTPSGRSIQKSYQAGNKKYYEEVHQRYTRGEVLDEKLSKASLDRKQSYKTASGRTVFGGGGISPDLYIPLDTSGYTPMYRELFSTGAINEFVYGSLVREIRPRSMTDFVNSFSMTRNQFQRLLDLARRKKIRISPGETAQSRKEIENGVKALTAQYFFGNEGYFRVVNSSDPVVRKAMSVIKQEK